MRIWLVADSDDGEDAQVGGRIRYLPEPNCFVATGSEPEPGTREEDYYQPVLWPHGTEIVATDPPTLDVPGFGHLTDGRVIYGGGAAGSPPGDLNIPAQCFGNEAGGEVIYMQRYEE